jgi:hypothetical protein
MRIICFYCHKPVSTELPDNTIFRAIATCPECIESGKDKDDEAVIGFWDSGNDESEPE